MALADFIKVQKFLGGIRAGRHRPESPEPVQASRRVYPVSDDRICDTSAW
jgi:hypothetical protein